MADENIRNKIKGDDRENVMYSAGLYLQNNFKQIDHSKDRRERWTDNNGHTRNIGITAEGLRYDADNGPNYGKAMDIRQMRINGWVKQ